MTDKHNSGRNKDNIFAQPMPPNPFEFNEQIADVFDNMIQRSVPGYNFLMDIVAVIARRYGQPNSRCYDLGCSLGTATQTLREYLPQGCHVIGVDSSVAMVLRCQNNLRRSNSSISFDIHQQTIQSTEINNASIVLLNFTLQFIENEQRQAILNKIYQGMRPGGVLLLAEKISFSTSAQQTLQTELHHGFKRQQGYSDLEVAQKRTALENVLVPNTIEEHFSRLQHAGFTNVQACMQCLNFCALIAFKEPNS